MSTYDDARQSELNYKYKEGISKLRCCYCKTELSDNFHARYNYDRPVFCSELCERSIDELIFLEKLERYLIDDFVLLSLELVKNRIKELK